MKKLEIVGTIERTVSGGTRLKFTTKETAQLIRQALRLRFRGVKFSVRTEYASMYSGICINWADGPTQPEVERVTDRFTSRGFDGMTDSTTYHEQLVDGQRVSYSGSINVRRETSDSLQGRAYARTCQRFGVEPRADQQFWNDYRPAEGNRTIGEETSATLYTMRPNGVRIMLKDGI